MQKGRQRKPVKSQTNRGSASNTLAQPPAQALKQTARDSGPGARTARHLQETSGGGGTGSSCITSVALPANVSRLWMKPKTLFERCCQSPMNHTSSAGPQGQSQHRRQ